MLTRQCAKLTSAMRVAYCFLQNTSNPFESEFIYFQRSSLYSLPKFSERFLKFSNTKCIILSSFFKQQKVTKIIRKTKPLSAD